MRHLINARHIALLLFISLITLLSGCTKEDMSQCGVVFHFRYNNNEVHTIDLLLFSEDGTLSEKHTFDVDGSTATRHLSVSSGKYRAVAWANNSASEQMQNMYSYSQNNQDLLYYSDKIKGREHLLPIFHGTCEPIVIDGMGTVERHIDMVRNTKQINIEVTSTTYNNISCEIMNHNRNHTIDNTPYEVLYSLPHDTPSTRSSRSVTHLSYTTHRLRGVAENSSSIEIYGEKNGVRERLFSESLVGLLLQNPQITEEILDSQDVFDLTFEFDSDSNTDRIIIHIEDYKIIYMHSDLG